MGEFRDKVKGKAKQLEGRITGDRSRRAEGVADEVKGNLKGAFREVKDAAKNIGRFAKNATQKHKRKST